LKQLYTAAFTRARTHRPDRAVGARIETS